MSREKNPVNMCRAHRIMVGRVCANCAQKGPHYLGAAGVDAFTCSPVEAPAECYYCRR